MKVSLNTIKHYTGIDVSVDELVTKINRQLGKVEEIIDLKTKYKDAKIVKVVECEKHPDADRLSVCKIDAGTGQLIQVVCGAPNVRADMWAVWLPPASVVPSSFDTDEPFTLGSRELRGVLSHGMLAASDEMAIGSDHDGIIELTEYDLSEGSTLSPGAGFSTTFSLDEAVIEIENKMFTHRPDLFGQLGVAREIAGIQRNTFVSPKWYSSEPVFSTRDELGLHVFNEAGEKVPRFMAVAIDNVVVRPSPMWLQCALVSMGAKPINNIVDITNYVMLITAQPTHAYDYDKLRGSAIGARMAREGEKLELLNGKVYELDESDIVIADSEGVVGLAGVMGGANSEVAQQTTSIVLEVANFDMYSVRKTSMRHGLFTDAVTRFNKGQSSLQNSFVLNLLLSLLQEVVGAKQASSVVDYQSSRLDIDSSAIDFTPDFINKRLGLELSSSEIKQLLLNVELMVQGDESMSVKPPFWRTDLEVPEDVVEEVGRLYGFDKLPRELPVRSAHPATKNQSREAKRKVRESLSRAGANEVLTYSFVHKNIFKKAQQDIDQAFRLSNALSPDLQYYRLTVLPSLLDKVHMNIKAGYDEFVLYEIGKGHNKKYHANDDEGLPGEMEFVDLVYASKSSREGAAYYYVRTIISQLARDFGHDLKFKPLSETLDYPVTAPFDQDRSALVETVDGTFIGMIGELKQQVRGAFKLPDYVAAATLDMDGLKKLNSTARIPYSPLSKFPSVERDVSFAVPVQTRYAELMQVVKQATSAVDDVNIRTKLTDIYQQSQGSDTKNITLHFTLSPNEKTLDRDAAAQIIETIATVARERLNAQIV